MRDDLGAFLRMNAAGLKMAFGWMRFWVYALTLIVRPAAQVIFFGVMARFITNRTDVSFQLIGNSIQVCALVSLFMVADLLVSERQNGTLALVLMTPRTRFFLLVGRSCATGLHGLPVAIAALAIAMLVFRLNVEHAQWATLLLSLLASVFATAAMGVTLGSLGLFVTDINLLGNVVSSILLVLSGINFPVSALPPWLQHVSFLLPMTRGAEAARMAIQCRTDGLFGLLLGEVGVGLAWLVVGYIVMQWAERRAVRDGTLDLV